MGLTCMILHAAGCFRINYYTKLEEEKDGLNIYKLTNADGLRKSYGEFRGFECPLCYNLEKRKEIIDQYKEWQKKGYQGLSECYSNYDYNVKREDYADVFEFLEEFYKEIQDIKANYDENCYFKYTCPEKKTQIYILFEEHSKEQINALNFKFKDERYQYERWKNDENLKKTLLEERKKITEAYKKRERQNKINEKLRIKRTQLLNEWDEMNFKKEYQNYLKCINNFKFLFDPSEVRFLNKDKNDYNTACGSSLSDIFRMSNYGFEFVGGQKKFAEYVLQYSLTWKEKSIETTTIYNLIRMQPKEERMLKQFLDSNLEEYERQLEQEL